jgi:hypothetical protein
MSKAKSLKEQKEKAEIDKIRAETTAIRLGTLKDVTTFLTILFAGFAGAAAVRPADTRSEPPKQVVVAPVERRNSITDPPEPLNTDLALPSVISPSVAKAWQRFGARINSGEDPEEAKKEALDAFVKLRDQSQTIYGSDNEEARTIEFMIHIVEHQL